MVGLQPCDVAMGASAGKTRVTSRRKAMERSDSKRRLVKERGKAVH